MTKYKNFEYEEMRERERRTDTVFEFQNERFYDFHQALNALGQEGWDWTGTRGEIYYFKREILDDEDGLESLGRFG